MAWVRETVVTSEARTHPVRAVGPDGDPDLVPGGAVGAVVSPMARKVEEICFVPAWGNVSRSVEPGGTWS